MFSLGFPQLLSHPHLSSQHLVHLGIDVWDQSEIKKKQGVKISIMIIAHPNYKLGDLLLSLHLHQQSPFGQEGVYEKSLTASLLIKTTFKYWEIAENIWVQCKCAVHVKMNPHPSSFPQIKCYLDRHLKQRCWVSPYSVYVVSDLHTILTKIWTSSFLDGFKIQSRPRTCLPGRNLPTYTGLHLPGLQIIGNNAKAKKAFYLLAYLLM